jgi:methyl-accepting chemotaxis protein
MFDKFSLKTKLLGLCGALLFFTVLVGGVSYWGINKIDSSYNKIASSSLPKIQAIDNMYITYQKIRINLRTLGLSGLSKKEEEIAVKNTMEAIESYEKQNTQYQKIAFYPGEKELYEKLDRDWNDFKKIGARVFALQKSNIASDREKMVDIFLKDCPEAAEIYNQSMIKILQFHEHNAKDWVGAAESDASAVKNLQNVIMTVGLLGGLTIGFFFATSIARLLNEISSSLSTGSDKIADITSEISAASTSLSSSITQQASALQQTTSAVEQTSASVVSNADNAKKSAEISQHSKHSVQDGKEAVEEVINSISEISISTIEIKKQIDESNKEIAEIVKIINEIGTKTKVINEIVFQTKLLSFNASVEAARAGEHGKGFAVVAEEVGNLARMSGDSAKEISDLLESSIVRVQETVDKSKLKIETLMELSRKKVEQGNETANRCSHVLDEIIANVNNVDSMISEISSASNEQSQSIREITKAMSEIDSASHQNSSSSQQTSEAADNLGSQVEDFRALVVRLNQIVSGQKTA